MSATRIRMIINCIIQNFTADAESSYSSQMPYWADVLLVCLPYVSSSDMHIRIQMSVQSGTVYSLTAHLSAWMQYTELECVLLLSNFASDWLHSTVCTVQCSAVHYFSRCTAYSYSINFTSAVSYRENTDCYIYVLYIYVWYANPMIQSTCIWFGQQASS